MGLGRRIMRRLCFRVMWFVGLRVGRFEERRFPSMDDASRVRTCAILRLVLNSAMPRLPGESLIPPRSIYSLLYKLILIQTRNLRVLNGQRLLFFSMPLTISSKHCAWNAWPHPTFQATVSASRTSKGSKSTGQMASVPSWTGLATFLARIRGPVASHFTSSNEAGSNSAGSSSCHACIMRSGTRKFAV